MSERLDPEIANGVDEAQRLAAYLPVTMVKRIMHQRLPQPGEATELAAATLFADISGFTPLSEELATDGPRGAEEVNRVLLLTFTAMIDVIHQMGGAVSHFYGDAMSVYFPDEDGSAAQRALFCAQQLQELMRDSFSRVITNRPAGKSPHFALTIKIGVGYGSCQELLVGNGKSNLEFVLTGTAVDEAAAAEKRAQAGEVIASSTVLQQAGLPATDAFEVFRVDQFPQPPAQPLFSWESFSPEEIVRSQEALRPFVPRALLSRIQSTVPELAEHRPATSLFIQFLLPGDEDDTSTISPGEMAQQLLQYYLWVSRIVKRFGAQNGRLNRVLTADKGNQLHIIFGAPVAPDAPEQALRCALALQQELADSGIRQKIGITVGKVFAAPVGSTTRREYTIVGDLVNLSARLMQVAAWGDILVNETLADRVGQSMRFAPLPHLHVKGKQQTIKPFRLLRERTANNQMQSFLTRWQRPMVGRRKELTLLQRLMDAAVGGRGSVIGVIGPAGVGKSRFIARGLEYWLIRGGTGVMGVCHQHLADTPYAPWRDAWREFFGLTHGMNRDEQVAKVTKRTQELLPAVSDDIGLWQDVLGISFAQSEHMAQLEAEARQKRLFSLLRGCLREALAERPLCILLEGIHWADQASLALLDDLARLTNEYPLLLIFARRPEDPLEIKTLHEPYYQEMMLADLSPDEAREYLQQFVGPAQLPQGVEQQLGLRDREGRESPVNPLFLEEAINVMLSAGILAVDGRVTVNEALLAQMPLPDTIHGLLLARLDRLPPEGRDLLQVAAVIGREFSLEPLRSICETASMAVIISILNNLTAADLTRLLRTDPDWVYLFHHAMTHEVAYESLSFSRRQMLHAAFAEWLIRYNQSNLSPHYAEIAYHFSRALNHEAALQYAVLAGDEAQGIFANQEAVELYKLGAEHLAQLPIAAHWETAVHLHLAMGESLRFSGDFNQAVGAVAEAQRLAEAQHDFARMAACYNLLAELRCRQALFAEAEELTTLVTEELPTAVPPQELARAYHWGGVAASSQGNFDVAAERLEKAEALCVETADNARLARVLESLAFIHYLQKDLPQALTYMQRSVDLSRDLSHPANLASSLSNISLVQFQLGQAGAALRTLDEAIELARESSQNFLAQVIGNRGEILAYLGRYTDAVAAFDQAIEMFSAMDDEESLIEVLLLKGYEYHGVRGEWREAERIYDRLDALVGTIPDRYQEFRARLRLGRALSLVQRGKYDQALSALIEAELLLEEIDSVWWLPMAYYLGSVIYGRLNIRSQAEAYIENAVTGLTQGGCPDYEGLILLQKARLAAPEERLALLQRAVNAMQRRSRYGDRAVGFQDAAAMLAGRNGEGETAVLITTWRDLAAQYPIS